MSEEQAYACLSSVTYNESECLKVQHLLQTPRFHFVLGAADREFDADFGDYSHLIFRSQALNRNLDVRNGCPTSVIIPDLRYSVQSVNLAVWNEQ